MSRKNQISSAAVIGILISGMSLCFSAAAAETETAATESSEVAAETETAATESSEVAAEPEAAASIQIEDGLEAKITSLTVQETGTENAEMQMTAEEFEKFQPEAGKTYKVSVEYEDGTLELTDAALADWSAWGLELSEPAVRWIKAKKGLNMRMLPTMESAPVSSIPAGTEVKVIGTCSVKSEEDDGNWVLIEYNSQNVFVAGWHVTDNQEEAQAAREAWEAEQAALAAQAAQAQAYSGRSGSSGKTGGKKSSGPTVIRTEKIENCDNPKHGTLIKHWSDGRETYENY